MITITVSQIFGALELLAKLREAKALSTSAKMRRAFEEATDLVANDVREYAPFWPGRGDLRASFEDEVVSEDEDIYGMVYSDLEYAPFQERGTMPGGYFPNWDRISEWAEDHGWDPWVISLHIYNVGTEAKKYAERALFENEAAILELVGAATFAILEGSYSGGGP